MRNTEKARTKGRFGVLAAAATWRTPVIMVLGIVLGLSPFGCRCTDDVSKSKPVTNTPAATESAAVPTTTAPPEPVLEPAAPATLTGASVTRSPDAFTLYVADEVNSALHLVPLPLEADASFETVKLPGPPAQVVASEGFVWVTIRDPGLLWIGRVGGSPDAGTTDAGAPAVVEVERIALPSDAWGLSVLPGLSRAIVTSAWTSKVTYVDLRKHTALWTVDVAREPRGVAVSGDGGLAFVSHLVGAHLTLLSLADEAPQPERVLLPPAPLRSPGGALHAALGYAGTFSPDQTRYFAARHAVGALGKNSWFGASTVDVLRVTDRTPLAPERPRRGLSQKSELAEQLISGADTEFPGSSLAPVSQPRALLYRRTTDTLLVLGEGDDRIVELDALAVDPTMAVVGHYQLGADYHPVYHVAGDCAAPSGMVLSVEEDTLWVHCLGSNDLAEVRLIPSSSSDDGAEEESGVKARLRLLPDPLGPGGATGRKLFHNSTDFPTSGGLACAGCHPEGRDDGHVWHEATFTTEDGDTTNFVGHAANIPKAAHTRGYARRTPMLAGRVAASGPYGWHAESPSIVARELQGFGLHRWGAVPTTARAEQEKRARALFDFLRRGLVPPARAVRPLTPQEKLGEELFSSKAVGCADCHPPKRGYTTRQAYPLPLLPLASGFDEDPNGRYKIPGLTFLAGRAPYFHDGSAASLDELIANNGSRMGNTAQLTDAERAALVAFLKTL